MAMDKAPNYPTMTPARDPKSVDTTPIQAESSKTAPKPETRAAADDGKDERVIEKNNEKRAVGHAYKEDMKYMEGAQDAADVSGQPSAVDVAAERRYSTATETSEGVVQEWANTVNNKDAPEDSISAKLESAAEFGGRSGEMADVPVKAPKES